MPFACATTPPAGMNDTNCSAVKLLSEPSTIHSRSCSASYCKPDGPKMLPGAPPFTAKPVAITSNVKPCAVKLTRTMEPSPALLS